MKPKKPVIGVFILIQALSKINVKHKNLNERGQFYGDLCDQLLIGADDPDECDETEAGKTAQELLIKSIETMEKAAKGAKVREEKRREREEAEKREAAK